MSKKISVQKILTYIAWFLLLLYPFNCTIAPKIYPNNYILLFTIFGATILLLFMNNLYKIKKSQISIVIFTLFFLLIVISNNHYVIEGRNLNFILYITYSFIPFILSYNNKNTNKIFEKVLIFFLLEHIIATLFIQIFNGFYVNNIISWLLSDTNDIATKTNLIYWSKMGYNPGITTHYSTNGIYLATASIFFFSKYIHNTKKKNLLLTIISFIALLLTAKRAHILFSAISCIIMYIFSNQSNISKKAFKFIIFGIIIVIGLIILSSFIPALLNVFERFTNGDLLNGREIFYETCLDQWLSKPLIGNGWGYFSYYYELNIYDPRNSLYLYHYLDAHNVFLQLLCEVGMIGFIFIFSIMAYILKLTKKYYNNKYGTIYNFAFGYQIFFLLYCLSGNPLYDIQCYSIYFIVVGIIIAKKIKLQTNQNTIY